MSTSTYSPTSKEGVIKGERFNSHAVRNGFVDALFTLQMLDQTDYRMPGQAYSRYERNGRFHPAAVSSAGFGVARRAQSVVQDAAPA